MLILISLRVSEVSALFGSWFWTPLVISAVGAFALVCFSFNVVQSTTPEDIPHPTMLGLYQFAALAWHFCLIWLGSIILGYGMIRFHRYIGGVSNSFVGHGMLMAVVLGFTSLYISHVLRGTLERGTPPINALLAATDTPIAKWVPEKPQEQAK